MQTLEQKIYYKTRLGIVRQAKIGDVFELAKTMREEDKREIWRSHHKTPEQALLDGFLLSNPCYAIERNEQPVALFGANALTLATCSATIWFLASPEIEKIQRAFLRHSRHFIDLMLEQYSYLENWVDAENTKSIEWLQWLGAKIAEPALYGAEKALFRHFYFEKGSNV